MIVSNEEEEDIMKVAKSLEDSGLFIKDISKKKMENGAREQKVRFLNMLLGTLGASLLGNMLSGEIVICAGEETINLSFKNFWNKKDTTKMNLN